MVGRQVVHHLRERENHQPVSSGILFIARQSRCVAEEPAPRTMLFLPLDLAGMVVGLGRSVARVQRVGGGGSGRR